MVYKPNADVEVSCELNLKIQTFKVFEGELIAEYMCALWMCVWGLKYWLWGIVKVINHARSGPVPVKTSNNL